MVFHGLSTPTSTDKRLRNLHGSFLRSAEHFAERPALEAAGESLSYGELHARAASLAATLVRHTPAGGTSLTGVFAYRTPSAFVGVLGALLRGHGYVPLNRTFPVQRTRAMLERSGARALVVDRESAGQLDGLLDGAHESLLVILPEHEDVSELRGRWPLHTVLGSGELEAGGGFESVAVDPDAIAYLLFTSGSTGAPKGVMVSHRNVLHFVDAMVERYEITAEDRFSQTFDMTFDLSAFDMFVAWESGACVCCIPVGEVIKPGKFIRERALTVWFSVPSVGLFMKRLGMLKPDRYPSLRWSLFCGEPLPAEVARAWAEAAPNSIVENLYGPTEVTIACMLYRWDPERGPAESRHGIVPIGGPYPGMSALVVDTELREVAPGHDGELLMAGPQVSLGYWQDEEKTAGAFVVPPTRDQLHYRTGDLVRRPVAAEPMTYVGRVDHQIKVNGHRVELGEIESVLRELASVDAVVALGWPRTEAGAAAITAFVAGSDADPDELRAAVAERLPDYMVPRRIHVIDAIPLNANGKFDRPALVRSLEGQ
jgi:amino acid adenylation domain-containing protein